ncbi:MAG: molybdopterin-dependent oxidoreductase [Actinomycetes bacterium]
MLKSRPVRAAASVALCALVLGLAACSSSESSTSTTSKDAKSTSTTNPYGAGVVDPPGPTDVVLTVTGPGGTRTFTMDQLAALGTKDVTIDEPFVKRRIAFTGVPMAAIFATVGITGDVRVNTEALNEYIYDKSTAADFTGSDGLIAVAQEGQPVPVDQGGPIRIIFPDGTSLSKNLDAWNWSLEKMSVKGS